MTAVTVVAAATAALLVAPSATGTSEATVRESGRVVKVVDGDTFDVRADYDGNGTREVKRVRLIGADTPESKKCGYGMATRHAKNLLLYSSGRGRVVRLTSDVAGAVGIKSRILRRVSVARDGKRIDVTSSLLAAGKAVRMPFAGQTTNNARYQRLAERAATKKLGIFKGNLCNVVSSPGAQTIKIDLQWKADSNGAEHARITNHGPGWLDIDGWTVRAGGLTKTVPAGPAIAPLETITVHATTGSNSKYHRYLGSGMLWPDIDVLRPSLGGDGGYLEDPKGNVRAWQMYACTRNCLHPSGGAKGRLRVTDKLVDPDGNDGEYKVWKNEFVELTNDSADRVAVGRLVVDIKPWTVELPRHLVLNPGDRIVVRAGRSTDLDPYPSKAGVATHEFYLNATQYPPLTNDGGGGDQVLVRTYPGAFVECHVWGAQQCPAFWNP